MRSLKLWAVIGLVMAVTAPSFAAVYFNDFACTRQNWFGSGTGYFATNVNYSSRKFGRVGDQARDTSMYDFDRAAMSTWVQGFFTAAHTPLADPNQLSNGGAVTVTLNLTAYDSWEDTTTVPSTAFGRYTPGVRLSKGQDWVETIATFQTAGGPGYPWRTQTGAVMSDLYQHLFRPTLNMVMNAKSEQWGGADTVGGGMDVYVYDTPRPWVLDQNVAWAALMNPDAVGFQMIHDAANKPWVTVAGELDDNVGSIYGRLHGLTEYRPFIEVTVNTARIGLPPATHTYLPADFNQDLKVSFADYLILESNFGKTQRTTASGDANNDGKCSFPDYLILESEFGHTTTPEPATIGLLVAGGIALIRRRK